MAVEKIDEIHRKNPFLRRRSSKEILIGPDSGKEFVIFWVFVGCIPLMFIKNALFLHESSLIFYYAETAFFSVACSLRRGPLCVIDNGKVIARRKKRRLVSRSCGGFVVDDSVLFRAEDFHVLL